MNRCFQARRPWNETPAGQKTSPWLHQDHSCRFRSLGATSWKVTTASMIRGTFASTVHRAGWRFFAHFVLFSVVMIHRETSFDGRARVGDEWRSRWTPDEHRS